MKILDSLMISRESLINRMPYYSKCNQHKCNVFEMAILISLTMYTFNIAQSTGSFYFDWNISRISH